MYKLNGKVVPEERDFEIIRNIIESREKEEPTSSCNWQEMTDNDFWIQLVHQIVVKGSSKGLQKLYDSGEIEEFDKLLNLNQILKWNDTLSESEVESKILAIIKKYHVGIYHLDYTKSIMISSKRSEIIQDGKFVFKKVLDKYWIPGNEITPERITNEREVRKSLTKALRFSQTVKLKGDIVSATTYHPKYKSVSDLLMDWNYSICLFSLDNSQFKKLFDISLNDDDYENVENMLLQKVCPKFNISIKDLDRAFHYYK